MDKLFDLGGDWHVRWRRGSTFESMTFINHRLGEQIELGSGSVRTLREILHIDAIPAKQSA